MTNMHDRKCDLVNRSVIRMSVGGENADETHIAGIYSGSIDIAVNSPALCGRLQTICGKPTRSAEC